MSESGKSGTKSSAINDQITDSITAMQDLLKENSDGNVALLSYQIMAQATAMAMLNAVNQQQQMYILQNAVTTATAKAVLKSKPEEAIKIVNEAMNKSNVLETFNGLKNFMDDLTSTYNDLKKKAPAGSESKQETESTKKATPKTKAK